MPRIPTTPSPVKFAETWSADFKAAVTKAAGKDGRLSASEAKKLALRTDADKLFADTATRYFELTGKKTVSVDVIAKEMAAYAARAAEVASGGDKKLSLKDGEKLPDDLRDDFFFMRGKTEPKVVAPTPAPGSVVEALRTQLMALTDGLLMPSETDATFAFLAGQQLNGAPITAEVVMSQLEAQHDALIRTVMHVNPERAPLATRRPIQERDANQVISHIIMYADTEDPDSMARAEQFGRLQEALNANLTDLKVFRFGDVNISTFFVGRAASGELVALLTGQVET